MHNTESPCLPTLGFHYAPHTAPRNKENLSQHVHGKESLLVKQKTPNWQGFIPGVWARHGTASSWFINKLFGQQLNSFYLAKRKATSSRDFIKQQPSIFTSPTQKKSLVQMIACDSFRKTGIQNLSEMSRKSKISQQLTCSCSYPRTAFDRRYQPSARLGEVSTKPWARS